MTGSGKLKLLRASPLARYPWLRHAFTTRAPGEFNLTYSGACSPAAVTKNRQALLRALAARGRRWQLITLRQRHTDVVRVLGQAAAARDGLGGPVRERDGALKFTGDAALTRQPGLLLAVQVADCLPILLVDPEHRAVAAVHAGWRGTLASLAAKTAGRMRQEFGSRPDKLRAAVGPGIHRCCYEVGPELVESFEARFPYWEKLVARTEPSPSQVHWQQPLFSPASGEPRPSTLRQGSGQASLGTSPRPGVTAPRSTTFHLDLVEANRRQLIAAGLKPGHIWASPLCTACRTELLFSHRAEMGRTGRMMGVVGVAPG